MKKIVITWFVCVLGLVALFAWLGNDILPTNRTQTAVPSALINAAFTLESADGKTVTEKDFRGRYMMVFFGFTHCPDICPTTLLLVQNALGKLGAVGEKVQPILITVDPERDTPTSLGEYVSHFGNTIGLSGTPEQIKTAADNFKVYYSKVEMSDPSMGYMMNHSGFLYLIGPDGKYVSHFAYDVSGSELEASLRKYIH
jgi:cytochrome oxidase Cu insertion factor (SCO1/SenC/PrrC family)